MDGLSGDRPREGTRVVADGGQAVTVGADQAGSHSVLITGEDWLDAICPFLRARDGSWRSASPARDHRCWATDPPAEVSVLTQQRLCLVRAHDGCERFLHARALRAADLARGRPSGEVRLGAGSTHGTSGGGRRTSDRALTLVAEGLRSPRTLAVGALVTAVFIAGVVLFLRAGGPGTPERTREVPTAAAVATVPAVVDVTSGPDGTLRYRVRPQDTLRTIADRFGVSVRQLRQVNDLGDPPVLHEGDVLVVPR